MNERERLIELIGEKQYSGEGKDRFTPFPYGKTRPGTPVSNEALADHLIANGVTVQEWIPVTERLPDTIPCGAETEYSEAVNVLTDGRKVLTAIWNGLHWICDAEFWDAEFEEITHWTPVLLPLPPTAEGGSMRENKITDCEKCVHG